MCVVDWVGEEDVVPDFKTDLEGDGEDCWALGGGREGSDRCHDFGEVGWSW